MTRRKANQARSAPLLCCCAAIVTISAIPGFLWAQDAAPAPAAQAGTVQAGDPLREGFRDPGEQARPRVWWHWMNGNITADGVRKDMEWMRRVGIAGLQNFDAGSATPQLVETRLPFMSEGWQAVFRETAEYADELGLELAINASPGWSETGGPWVTGPDGMKKVVWSQTQVVGGEPFRGVLSQPPSTTGIFQTSTAGWTLGGRAPGQNPPELYVDQKVIAFPVPADAVLPEAAITSSGGTLDAAALSDGIIQVPAIDLPAGAETGALSWVQWDFGRPVTVRGLTFATPITPRFFDGLVPRTPTPAPTGFRLEASDDGRSWRDTGALVYPGIPQRTSSVDNVRARYFRFVSIRQAPEVAPDPLPRFTRAPGPPPESLPINELVLRGEPTVHSFEDKAAFVTNGDYFALPSGTLGQAAPASAQVIDLTDKMAADGSLDWTPPAGNWVVLRMGYSLTGAMNRPASPEATGLEVDKLDPAAVRRYMDRYLGMYREATGGLIGERGLRAMLFDSWEASHQNWTPGILAEFTRLRGYDATPFLPALAGYVIDTPERTDAFLWDWRRTVQELLRQNHYGVLSGMLHDAGMLVYTEGHEAIYSTMADGMEMKQFADIPMAAMWQANAPGVIEPVYFNDIQESASVAHIYGQNITAVEALTGGPRFGSAPWDLKPTADAILIAGANRFVIHTSTHQPVDRGPGMTLGVGQYFTRNETWAEQAGPWVDYLSRASLMLQQGRGASDLAVYYGEAGPIITGYDNGYPPVPEGYRYDYVNADVILNRLQVEDGALATETGMRYGALVFGNRAQRVTLAVLERLLEMVEAGAVLVAERPLGSPSLADDPARVSQVLDRLWPGEPVASVGMGKVFASADPAAALQEVGLAPDFTYSKPDDDSHVMFIHRRLPDGDAYFLSNRRDRAETITASFRVSGRAAELWDPATGEARPASYRAADGGRTEVTVPLDRFGSTFVVFRGQGESGRTVPEAQWTTLETLSGPWPVSFQPERGAPPSAVFPVLADFHDNSDPGIRYFSGIASYAKEVTLPESALAVGQRVWIDLGEVHNLAEVLVNGELAGTAWKPPYRVDITEQARAGPNEVELRVANLWVNRLIGDVQPGVTEKISLTAADGQTRPGLTPEQEAAARRMPYGPDDPLVPSGLIGPVSVMVEQRGHR